MEFGVLFTNQPNKDTETYPYRDVHDKTTELALHIDKIGYDIAWVAEHHFSSMYGIMPDVYAYTAYLAGQVRQIKLGAAVVVLPMTHPVRVVENASFLDLLTKGKFLLGFGSGYRPYEFAGMGVPFDERRDIQEEVLPLIRELFVNKRVSHKGKYYEVDIQGDYELFPQSIQQPHPPMYLAAATERSIKKAAEHGLGVMFSSLTRTEQLADEAAMYKEEIKSTPETLRANPGYGAIDVARWVYVAETDEQARKDTEAGILKHMSFFDGKQTVGYLGTVGSDLYDDAQGDWYNGLLKKNVIVHGSPSTVIEKIAELEEKVGMTSLLTLYPPYYSSEQLSNSFSAFAEEVMPKFRNKKKAIDKAA
jgi:alkanesulfonate monooxygenase SsuD/methylene tetrahydromethanopterin reductase-like flavin-dependent oxidoreductase (luciferase family)